MLTQTTPPTTTQIRWSVIAFHVALLAAFSLAFFRTAWVSEDAFITFRVIDNLLNGFGLTWNPGERAQAYTHPLWLGLLTPAIAVFDDPYYVSLALSYILLISTLLIISKTVETWNTPSALMIISLLWSKSFIDYSSSGLENPLTHTLLAIYIWVWLKYKNNLYKSLIITGIASAIYITRPDAIVLILPSLVAHAWFQRRDLRRHFLPMILGGFPAIAWTLFSLFYYGTPVPNTALAKIATGTAWEQNAWQAWEYIKWTLQNDVVTAALVICGIIFGLIGHKDRLRPFAVGLLIWIGYLFYVGSDYMGGRFFSAPVLMAVAVCAVALSQKSYRFSSVAIGGLLLINITALQNTVFSPANLPPKEIAPSGIADERSFYYWALGLLPTLERGTWYAHPWLLEGQLLRSHTGVYTRCTIGMIGYTAGANVRLLDPLALTEPFLARLPARSNSRVGHYERAFPDGYLDSVLQDTNRVSDPKLHKLYQDVFIATRMPLLAPERFEAIWRLNNGFHSNAAKNFDKESIGLPGIPAITKEQLSCFGIPYWADATWKIVGLPAQPLRVTFKFTPHSSTQD